MTYKRALVREPGNSYRRCVSCHPLRDTIDVERARGQHARYCKTLAELGLEVIRLPRDDSRPDSCFVEDTAVVHAGKAMICRMAKNARRGEEDRVEDVLKGYVEVRRATEPGTLEGGDVIHLPDGLISGVTQRSNREGVKQMQEWLGARIRIIEDPSIVHLKSYVTYLSSNIMVATKEYSEHPVLKDFSVLIVPENEAYAANTLTIGDTVLVPEGRPKVREIVREAGFEVVALDTSEFEKCDGALTCLSLLF